MIFFFRRMPVVALAGVLVGLGGVLTALPAQAAICKSVDSQGKVHYAQCPDGTRNEVSVKNTSKGVHLTQVSKNSHYGGAVVSASPPRAGNTGSRTPGNARNLPQ